MTERGLDNKWGVGAEGRVGPMEISAAISSRVALVLFECGERRLA